MMTNTCPKDGTPSILIAAPAGVPLTIVRTINAAIQIPARNVKAVPVLAILFPLSPASPGLLASSSTVDQDVVLDLCLLRIELDDRRLEDALLVRASRIHCQRLPEPNPSLALVDVSV